MISMVWRHQQKHTMRDEFMTIVRQAALAYDPSPILDSSITRIAAIGKTR